MTTPGFPDQPPLPSSPEAPAPPTLKDVAARSGVSFSTVGKILRGERRFKADTVEKVQVAAHELGYRSNRAAAILASGHRKRARQREKLALVYWNKHANLSRNSYAAAGMQRARLLGYDIEPVGIDQTSRFSRHLDQLYAQGVDGLILCRVDPEVAWTDLDLDRFSVVVVARVDHHPPAPCVRSNVSGGIRKCFQKLHEAGCRRIGACLHRHQPLYLDDRDRRGAYLECWERFFPDQPTPRIYSEPMDCYEGLDEWVRREAFDGLIVFHAGDYLTLRNCGWRVPQDLRLACLTVNHANHPQMAGVEEQQARMFELAVDLVDQQMRHRIRGIPAFHVDYVAPVVWHPGETLPEDSAKTG